MENPFVAWQYFAEKGNESGVGLMHAFAAGLESSETSPTTCAGYGFLIASIPFSICNNSVFSL